jgi:hypothetical protein
MTADKRLRIEFPEERRPGSATKGVHTPPFSKNRNHVLRSATALLSGFLFTAAAFAGPSKAGESGSSESYKVLPPILHGNLAIFPVTSGRSFDTSQLMTLDEGVRSGQVTITETGDERGLVRPGQPFPVRRQGAEVNRLVLSNNSNRPLLLLAGEIVTGGKQDRVIGSDRIVPASTGPIDLGVFCVEPGRWVESSSKFGSMGAQMAQPSVRTPAMASRDQEQVWANVRASNSTVAVSVGGPEALALAGTTSYAKVFNSAPVQRKIAGYGGSEGEQAILRELRAKGAVGVVVAVNGRVMWADIFASTDLLSKYWPKLMRSYVAEAMTTTMQPASLDVHAAELFISTLSGGREVAETEPGVYRRTDVTGDGYRVFELLSLLPKAEFKVHITKMAD